MTNPVYTKQPEMNPQTPPEPTKKVGLWHHMGVEVLSGGIGGAVGTYMIAPLMYLKMYKQEKARNLQNPPKFEKNPIKWFTGGIGIALWMFPQSAFAFSSTKWMRQKLSDDGQRDLTPGEKLACSSISGGLLSLLVCPQEMVWTQQIKAQELRQKMIELQKLDPKTVPVKNAVKISQEIWNKYGIRGFYRAAPETAGREIVSASVLTYLVIEYPILGPIIGAVISQPLDGRKTNKQADFAYKAPFMDLFKAKAFSGLIPRIGLYFVFMNAAPWVKNQCEQRMLPLKNQ